MPAFNECRTVAEAVDQVLGVKYPVEEVELLVVDDGSSDGTGAVLDEIGNHRAVKVFHHERNQGKGAAVRTGLEHARGTYAAIMDADLEYEPGDLAKLLEPLLDDRAEAVFGARGFQAHSAYGFWYVIGNKGVSFFANLLYNSWVSDIMTGEKVMSTALFRSLDLREPGFAIEPEITATACFAAGSGSTRFQYNIEPDRERRGRSSPPSTDSASSAHSYVAA